MVNTMQALVSREPGRGGEHVGARVSCQQVEELDALVEAGAFLNRSDAVRTPIRDMVSKVRIFEVRQVSVAAAGQEILSYLKNVGQAYPSDIADALRLDYDLVMSVFRELRQSGEVEPA